MSLDFLGFCHAGQWVHRAVVMSTSFRAILGSCLASSTYLLGDCGAYYRMSLSLNFPSAHEYNNIYLKGVGEDFKIHYRMKHFCKYHLFSFPWPPCKEKATITPTYRMRKYSLRRLWMSLSKWVQVNRSGRCGAGFKPRLRPCIWPLCHSVRYLYPFSPHMLLGC